MVKAHLDERDRPSKGSRESKRAAAAGGNGGGKRGGKASKVGGGEFEFSLELMGGCQGKGLPTPSLPSASILSILLSSTS